ncbi:MAG TPA: hypothetical protein PKY05_00775 [Fibrobacteria bacterium]|nr:hypothetical protein [Fibrobacteria bacterium]
MFLFTTDDLLPIPVEYQSSRWMEWKLAAPKAQAIERFRDRIGQLRSWHLPRFDLEENAFELAATLERWEGSHLAMDPEEVFGGCGLEGDRQEDFLRTILSLLDSHSPSQGRIDPRELGPCSYSLEPKDFHHHSMDFLGTTCAWDESQ